EFGIFLDITYRLHPDICTFISSAVYDDRLHSHPDTGRRYIILPASGTEYVNRQSGILYVPVDHDGNTQGSDEEVDAIGEIISELLKCKLRGVPLGRPANLSDFELERPVQADDILVVAPYNLQVRLLKAKHLPEQVGTVDKFQGQEKPIVIVSMC